MIEPHSGMRFAIPHTLIRPAEDGELMPDGLTVIRNLFGEKWWAKPDGLDQKEILVCLNSTDEFTAMLIKDTPKFEKLVLKEFLEDA